MGSTNIQIAIKVRPFIERENREKLESLWLVKENSIVQIDCQKNFFGEHYSFDHIFDETKSNKDVYNTVVKPMVLSCLEGINSTIFAYGQTSSGKTHTMLGDTRTPGIISFTVQDVFALIRENTTKDFLLRCSYLEIYNEKINDLLDTNNTDVKIREDHTQGVYVVVKEEVIREPEELFSLMKRGMKTRKIGCTDMNERSSRSHTIFKLVIQSQSKDSEGSYTESTLNLVDLAGSERVGQMNMGRERQVEGVSINKSLTTLGLVIRKLSENEQYINYRDSKLTRLLQHSLGGNSRTLIIATITVAAAEETKSTLDFAQRAKFVKNRPIINERVTDKDQLKQYEHLCEDYKEQIEKLRLEKIERDKTIDALEGKISNIKLFTAGNIEKMLKPSRIPHRRHTLGHCKPRKNKFSIMDSGGLEDISDNEDLESVLSPVKSEICFHFSNEDDKENSLLCDSVCSSQSKEVVPKNLAIPTTLSPNLRREKELLEESFHNLKLFTNLEKQLQGKTDKLEELRELTERLRDENFMLREESIKRGDSFIQLMEHNKDVHEKLLILRTILGVKPFEDIRRKSLHTIEEEGIELSDVNLDSSASGVEVAEDIGEINKITDEVNKKCAAIIEENQHLKRQIMEKERIIDDLSTEKINQETVCANLDEENKNLKNQIDLKVAAISKLNASIREHNDVKEAELEILNNKIIKLTNYKEEMHKKLSELQEALETSSGKEDISALKVHEAKLKEDLEVLRKEHNKFREVAECDKLKIGELEEELSKVQSENNQIIADQKLQLDTFKKANQSLEEQIEKIKYQLNQFYALPVIDDVQQLLEQRVRDIENLQRENERLVQRLDNNATLEQTVQSYRKDIDNLQIKCEDQKDEINELRNQLHSKVKELDEKLDITSKFNTKVVEYECLTNENEQLRKELNILSNMQNETCMMEEKLEVNRLKNINEDLIKQLKETHNIISENSLLKEENERLKSECQDTLFQLSGEQKELEKICKEVDEKTRNIEAFEQIISNLKNNLQQRVRDIANLQRENESLVQRLDNNANLEQTVQSYRKDIDTLQIKCEDQKDEINELRNQLHSKVKELDEKMDITSKFNTKVVEYECLTNENKQLRKELNDVQQLLQQRVRDIENLQRENESLVQRFDNNATLEQTVQSYRKDIDTLQIKCEDQKDEINELRNQLHSKVKELDEKVDIISKFKPKVVEYECLTNENEQLRKELNDVQQLLQQRVRDIENLQRENESLVQRLDNNATLEQTVQNYRKDIDTLQIKCEDQKDEINELRNQLHSKVKELDEKMDITSKFNTKVVEYECLTNENEQLRKELNDVQQLLQQRVRDIENLQRENESLVQRLDNNATLEQTVQSYRKDIDTLQIKCEDQKDEINELRNQLHSKVKELDEKVDIISKFKPKVVEYECLTNENEQLRKELNDVQQLLQQRVRDIENLQRENESLVQRLDNNATLEQTVQNYRKDIDTLQIKCEDQKDEINELRNQLHSNVKELDEKMDITSKFNTKVVEYECLTNENEQLKKELNDVQQLLQQRVRDIENLQRENESLVQRLDNNATLEQTVQSYRKDIDTLQIKCEDQKDEINELRNQLHSKVKELDEKMDITSEFNTKVVEYKCLTNENEQLRKELIDVQQLLQQRVRDIENLQRENERLVQRLDNNATLEQTVQSYRKDIDTQIRCKDQKDEINELRNQLHSKVKELDEKMDITSKFNTKMVEYECLTNENEQLRKELNILSNRQNEKCMLEEKLEVNRLKNINEDLIKQLKETHNIISENSLLKEENERLKSECQGTLVQLSEEQKELKKMCKEVDEKTRNIEALEQIISNLKINRKEICDKNALLEQTVQSYFAEIQKLRSLSEAKESDIEKIKSQLNSKITEHECLINENTELKKQLQTFSQMHQSNQERLNQEKLKTSRLSVSDDLKLKIQERSKFKEEIDKLQKEKSCLEENLCKAENKIIILEQALRNNETAGGNEDLKQQSDRFKRRYMILESQFNTEKRKTESLGQQLLSSQREVASLQAKVNYLAQHKKRIPENHPEKNPVSRLSDEGRPMSPNDLRKIKRQSIHDQHRGLSPDFGSLFDDEDLGCSECVKLKTELSACQDEKTTLVSEINDLKKENKFLDKENDDMLKMIHELEKKENELHETLDKYKGCSECVKLKTELSACQDEKTTLLSEINDLKKDNKFLDKENDDMLKMIQELEKKENQLHETLDKYKNVSCADDIQLQSKLNDAIRENTELQNKLKMLEEGIEKYKEELARVESKLPQAEFENLQADSKNILKSEKGTQATCDLHLKYSNLKKLLVLRRREGNYLRAQLNLPPDCAVLPEDLQRQQKPDPLKDNAP